MPQQCVYLVQIRDSALFYMWRNIYSPDVADVSRLMESCQLELTFCTVRTCNEKDCTNGINEYTIQQYDAHYFEASI